MNIYRHCCHDKGSKPATVKYVKDAVNKRKMENKRKINCVTLGFEMKNNNLQMRMQNGNGKQKRLVLCHQNLQGGYMSTEKKIVDIESIVTSVQPDILGISETEMTEDMMTGCHVEGYVWELKRSSSRISVLMNNSLDYKRRADLELDNFAAIWIEVSPKNKNSILVCNVYREWRLLDTPNSESQVENEKRWKAFVAILKAVAESGKELHVYGDINLNRERWLQVELLRRDEEDDEGYSSDSSQPPPRPPFTPAWWQKLVDHLYSEVLSDHPEIVQLIKKPTWFKQVDNDMKQSCLDLYFTNEPHKISSLNLVKIAKSDHLMIVCHRRSQTKIPKPTIIRKRQWSKINYGLLRTQMSLTSFEDDILSCEDLDKCVLMLTAVIRVHLDAQAQVKNYQVKKKFCAWVDEASKMTILRKQKLHSIWKRTRNKEDYKKYREVSNFLSWDLRRKKSAYIQQKIRSTVGSHNMWEAAKTFAGWKKSGGPTSLSVNGELTSKNDKMAQAQQDFFIKKIETHKKNIPPAKKDPLEYTRNFLKEKFVPEFGIGSCFDFEVVRVIEKLNPTDACGEDDISSNCLKEINGLIAPSLAHIITLSFHQGKFPTPWKTAKVTPLFKNSGERNEMKNYRPIALLPSLSKIIEKLVAERLTRHLESNGLLSDKQHGYRKHRSTATCLLQLQEEIMERYENGQDSVIMCFDSSAAFDTISHSIILDKLALYGVSEFSLRWFRSYLSERKQYTEIGGKRSTLSDILQGVFQGSVLGPLLYIMYVNCMSTLEDENTSLSQYADDTTANTALTRNKNTNHERIKKKADEMQDYMDANSLRFNPDKTQILVKTKGINNTHGDLKLEMKTGTIEQTDIVKILGVYLSKDELFKEYLVNSDKSMMKYLTSRLNMLKILSRYADMKARKSLAEGLILSKLNYCISLWSTTLKSNMDKIQILLNKVVRVVLKTGKRERLAPQYGQLRWLDIWQTRRYFDIIQLNTIINFNTPKSIAQKFVEEDLPRHNTRSTSNPNRLNSKTLSRNLTKQKGFVCRAAKLYANLPPILLKTNPPRHVFKDTVRCNIGGFEMKDRTLDYYIREVCQNRAEQGEWEMSI